jgi:hypothetical protein
MNLSTAPLPELLLLPLFGCGMDTLDILSLQQDQILNGHVSTQDDLPQCCHFYHKPAPTFHSNGFHALNELLRHPSTIRPDEAKSLLARPLRRYCRTVPGALRCGDTWHETRSPYPPCP